MKKFLCILVVASDCIAAGIEKFVDWQYLTQYSLSSLI